MKKKNLFTMLVATVALAFGVTSCNNDDDAKIPAGGDTAVLSVKLDAPVMSRATSTTGAPADAVDNYTVFVTDKSTGNINSNWSQYSNSSAPLTGIAVTTNAELVYIVANAGDLRSEITSLADLNAHKADLDGTDKQTAARWATGVTATALNFTPDSNGDYKADASVTLKFIAARIAVTVDNSMTNYGAVDALTLESIAVLNAGGESLLFGTSLIPGSPTTGKRFYTGYDKPSGETWAYWPGSTEYSVASSNLLFDALALGAPSTTYYYYVFENNAAAVSDFPTIVTLIGKSGDGTKNLYWPVHLASYEKWTAGSDAVTTVTRGHSYNIKIKLSGDAKDGGGNTPDPTNPVVNGSVEVSVSLEQWVPVALDKEFK